MPDLPDRATALAGISNLVTEATSEVPGGTPTVASPTAGLNFRSASEAAQAFEAGKMGGTGVTGGLQPGAGATLDSGGLPEEMQRRFGVASGALARQKEKLKKQLDISREGVPLDEVSGVKDLWLRARMHQLPDPRAKLQFLAEHLIDQGINIVDHQPRFADGKFILPQKDEETGAIKDVVIDEPGFSLGDIADLANEAIVMGAGLAVERKAALGKLGSLFKGPKMRLFAGGAGVTGGRFGQTVAARAAAGVEQDVSRDITSALVEGGGDVLGGFTVGKLVSTLHTLAAPNRMVTRLPSFKAFEESIARLEEGLGMPIRMSPGQLLLNENMLVFESFAGTQIGGESLRAVKEATENLRIDLTKALSQYPGRNLINTQSLNPGDPILRDLWTQVNSKQTSFLAASDEVTSKAVRGYIDASSKATSTKTVGSAAVVGNAVRNFLDATRTTFRNVNKANYNEANRRVEQAGAALGNPLLAEQLVKVDGARGILRDFAKAAKISKLVPGAEVIDPMTGIVQKAPPTLEVKKSKALLPEFFSKWDAELADMEQGISLTTANELRRAMADDIKELGGFGGLTLGTRATTLLGKLRGAIGDAMGDAYDKLPDGAAKDALQKADSYYNSNVTRFQTPTVEKILNATPDGLARMPDDAIITEVAKNPQAYREMKEFYKGDPMWGEFKKGILDDILDSSALEGSPKVSDIHQQLLALPKSVRADLLGKEAPNVLRTLRKVGDLDLDNPTKSIDYDTMKAWLREPSSSTKDAVIKAHNDWVAKEAEFKSALKKKAIKKFQSPELLDSKDTVNMLLDSATEEEAKWAVGVLGKGPLRDKLAQQTMEELFRRSHLTGKLNVVDLGFQQTRKNFVNAATIRDQILGPKKDVYKALLGDESYQLATDYFNFLSRGDLSKELQGPAVGTLSRGGFINNMFEKFGKNTYLLAKWKLVSMMMTTPTTRNWLLRKGFEAAEVENALPAILASGITASRYATSLANNTLEGDQLALDAYVKTLETMGGLEKMVADAREEGEATTPEQP